MKASPAFQTAIKEQLDSMAAIDEVFAEKYKNPAKKLEDCVTYILNTVQKTGQMGFADEEIYGMAAHYYDEADIDIGKANSNMRAVVNHHIDAPKKSFPEKVADKVAAAPQQPVVAKKPIKSKPVITNQPSLF